MDSICMLMKRFTFIFVALIALQSWANPLSFLEKEPEFLPVEQAFEFNTEVIAPGKVEIFWTIADGYYLYKEKLEFDSSGAELETVNLPQGESHEDEFFGTTEVYRNNLLLNLNYQANAPTELVITYMGCADAGLCYPPTRQKISLPKTLSTQKPEPALSSSQNELAEQLSSSSLLATLGLFFLLGLGLAFTPCVFPMYPILSAAISGSRNISKPHAFVLSFSYVQGMALTYTLLGLLVASFGMQLQSAFQHPAVLITLSLLFAVLSLSMFGVFNLQLPQSWQNRLQHKSQGIKGGRLGAVFVLGIIAGLVASPCTTAPLSAALLYVGQSGDLLIGGLSLYLLSLGMGLPLLIMGTLGASLLPKAGGWMNTIKHLLGFVTLAVPLFLLERILPETTAQLLWSALLILSGAYLLFALREVRQAVVGTLAYAIAAIMLVSGVLIAKATLWPTRVVQEQHLPAAEFIQVANLTELQQQLALAENRGKPVLVDFYADWCVACKEFDKYTFPDARVKATLAEFVLIRIDVTASSEQDVELLEHFQILGLPSLLLFSSNGGELTQYRIAGFLKPELFISHIERAYSLKR